MRYFVTGAAGFIGSHFVDRLLSRGDEVIAYDNLSTGFVDFLDIKHSGLKFIQGDLLSKELLARSVKGCDFVFHFAANADIRFGFDNPDRDISHNTIATFNLLEAMRLNGVKDIAFFSSSSVYGEFGTTPMAEDGRFPLQNSLYGASKLACEGMIEAYCAGFGFKSWIFRPVSVLGGRYTHGHLFDFYVKLTENPDRLPVLGNGHQKKSYIDIEDLMDAVFLLVSKTKENVNIFNIGREDYFSVCDSVQLVCGFLNVSPEIRYSDAESGWIGDSPYVVLDISRAYSYGWRPRVSIRSGMLKTLQWLRDNPQIVAARRAKL